MGDASVVLSPEKIVCYSAAIIQVLTREYLVLTYSTIENKFVALGRCTRNNREDQDGFNLYSEYLFYLLHNLLIFVGDKLQERWPLSIYVGLATGP